MNLSFARLEEGYENALKDYYKKQVHSAFCVELNRVKCVVVSCQETKCIVLNIHAPTCMLTHTHTHTQVSQLNTLITHLLGELTKGDRQKIMTICTIDVHARDVVAKLIQQKVENSQAFIWLSQLRHRYSVDLGQCIKVLLS